MGRIRNIEPELFENPVLRRLGFVSRDLFVFLFCSAADDEGRFDWEPFAFLEAVFTRNDPVTQEQCEAALDALAAENMLLRYGEGSRLGFVTGWFAHQPMDTRLRRNSSRPPPPVEVDCWSRADAVRRAYTAKLASESASGKADPKQASYREALRWFAARDHRARKSILAGASDATREKRRTCARATREPLTSNSGVTREPLAEEGEVEGEGEVGFPTALPPPKATPSASPAADANTNGRLTPTEAETTPTKTRRERPREQDTEVQAVIREAWEAWGNTGPPGPEKGTKQPKFSSAMQIAHTLGCPLVRQWAAFIRSEGREVPDGAKPWPHFLGEFRKAAACPENVGWRRQASTNGPARASPDDLPEVSPETEAWGIQWLQDKEKRDRERAADRTGLD